jgi:hypothetical protein
MVEDSLKRRILLKPTMASVAYRGKVEERYQANALIDLFPVLAGAVLAF